MLEQKHLSDEIDCLCLSDTLDFLLCCLVVRALVELFVKLTKYRNNIFGSKNATCKKITSIVKCAKTFDSIK